MPCIQGYHGLKKNESRAAELFSIAGARGHGSALCFLGCCYRSGQGVSQNQSLGDELIEDAAKKVAILFCKYCSFCYYLNYVVDYLPFTL